VLLFLFGLIACGLFAVRFQQIEALFELHLLTISDEGLRGLSPITQQHLKQFEIIAARCMGQQHGASVRVCPEA